MDAREYRRHLSRANELPLLYAVMAFQFACMLLLAFRDGAPDAFSLRMSVFLPAGTYFGLKLLSRLWPIDRAVYIQVAFLGSLSVILLRAVFRKTDNAADQATYLLVSLAPMLFGVWIVRALKRHEGFCAALMPVCLALLVLPFGFTNTAARNWVRLGGMQFQPSELVKPVTVVILASGFSRGNGVRGWWKYALYGALCCGILLVEKDLGAMLLYYMLVVAMFYAGTGNRRLTLAVLLITVVAGVLFVKFLDRIPAFTYVAKRIAIWKNPWNSPDENSRQIMQGLISIASGGIFGAGLGLGSADRVAVVASDYIFAAVSEEFGILFALCVLAVYLTLALRGMSIALNARSHFHALIAFGCAFELTTQMLLIVCGNLHLIPLTGVTLPFVSEGGSSLMASAGMAGLLMGVASVNAQDEYDDLVRLNGGEWREDA